MTDKAAAFARMHVKGAPLVLYNCWDVGTAAAIIAGGAPAVATGSLAVAAAQGYPDGQALPMADLLALAERMVGALDVPVSIDFEGAYGAAPADVAAHAKLLAATGAIGMNFEDQQVGGEGMYTVEDQVARISAIRNAVGTSFFINARTDLFLKTPSGDHAGVVAQAIERGQAYAKAGASGFFVPKLSDIELIAQVCDQVPLPVNVMMYGEMPDHTALVAAGVARISYGPASYAATMAGVTAAAREAYSKS